MSYCQAPPLACSYPHCTCGIPRPRGVRGRHRRSSTPARAWWYAAYRVARITHRENAKAIADMVVYGTGFVRIGLAADEIQHVPIAEMREWA